MYEKRYKNLILWEISKIKWLPVVALAVMYLTSIVFKENMMLEDCRVISEGFSQTHWVIDTVCTGFNIFNIGWVLLLAFCQFNDDANIWYSLPYKKKDLHAARILTGIGFITLMLIVYTVWILIIFRRYEPVMEDINFLYPGLNGAVFGEGTLLLNMLITWAVLVFIYMLFVLCQYMVNQPVVAAVFSIIVLVTPFLITELLSRYLNFRIVSAWRFIYFPLFAFPETEGSMADYYTITSTLKGAAGNVTDIRWEVSQALLFTVQRFLYYVLLLGITLFVTEKCADSELRAENNGLLPGNIYGKVFITVITLFAASFFSIQFVDTVGRLAGLITFVFFAAVTYLITKFILRKLGVVLWQRK